MLTDVSNTTRCLSLYLFIIIIIISEHRRHRDVGRVLQRRRGPGGVQHRAHRWSRSVSFCLLLRGGLSFCNRGSDPQSIATPPHGLIKCNFLLSYSCLGQAAAHSGTSLSLNSLSASLNVIPLESKRAPVTSYTWPWGFPKWLTCSPFLLILSSSCLMRTYEQN